MEGDITDTPLLFGWLNLASEYYCCQPSSRLNLQNQHLGLEKL